MAVTQPQIHIANGDLGGGSGSGDVTGPASAVTDRVVTFNGTTGKVVKDGGSTIAQVVSAAVTAAEASILPVSLTSEVTGILPIANMATGTPTGSKFVRDDGTLAVPAGSGAVVQVVNTQAGAVASGTTVIPLDDTIPQKTEGDEYVTRAITPTNSSSKLRIDVVMNLEGSVAAWITAALFQDSGNDALAASTFLNAFAGSGGGCVAFTHYMTAGTTSSTTFKVRAGLDRAGTTTFNGAGAARRFGGVMASSLTITEIA